MNAVKVVLMTLRRGKDDSVDAFIAPMVKQGMAACVKVYPVVSHYVWENKLEKDEEYMLVAKSADVESLRYYVTSNHPYDVPEFVVLDVDAENSSAEYLQWVLDSVKKK